MAKARSHAGFYSITGIQHETQELSALVTVDADDSKNGQFSLIKQRTKKSIETLGANENEALDDETTDGCKHKDPLLMFGVLVPQSLRSSQTCFQRSLNVTAELCRVQLRISNLAQDYNRLITNMKLSKN